MWLKEIEQDSAQVKIPPPLVFLGLIILGLILDYFHPLPFLSTSVRIICSFLFLGTGISIMVWCFRTFKKTETNIAPWKTTTTLIKNGLYAYTRNPIYLAGMILLTGVGIACNSLWIIFMLIPFFLFLNNSVIPKEEKYLEEKFGKEYLSYKSTVRRWV